MLWHFFVIFLFQFEKNMRVGPQIEKSSWSGLMPDLMGVVLEFLSNGKGLNRFSWHVLPKLSKITVTCPKGIKRTK